MTGPRKIRIRVHPRDLRDDPDLLRMVKSVCQSTSSYDDVEIDLSPSSRRAQPAPTDQALSQRVKSDVGEALDDAARQAKRARHDDDPESIRRRLIAETRAMIADYAVKGWRATVRTAVSVAKKLVLGS